MITNYLKIPHTLSQREIDIRLIAIMYQKINKKDYDFASHKNANIAKYNERNHFIFGSCFYFLTSNHYV